MKRWSRARLVDRDVCTHNLLPQSLRGDRPVKSVMICSWPA